MLQGYDCGRLIISKLIQKTSIDVNEEGLEAAAASAVGVGVTSLPSQEDPILMLLGHSFHSSFIIGRRTTYIHNETLEGRLGKTNLGEEKKISRTVFQ